MTPEEMILTLRICGNHPKYDGFTCNECPWQPHCERDGGGAELSLRAADIIQQLLATSSGAARHLPLKGKAGEIGKGEEA